MPLAMVRQRGSHEIELAADKNTITTVPKIDPDGELAQPEEVELYRHYSLPYGEQRSAAELPEAGGQIAGQAGDAMTRSEEQRIETEGDTGPQR